VKPRQTDARKAAAFLSSARQGMALFLPGRDADGSGLGASNPHAGQGRKDKKRMDNAETLPGLAVSSENAGGEYLPALVGKNFKQTDADS